MQLDDIFFAEALMVAMGKNPRYRTRTRADGSVHIERKNDQTVVVSVIPIFGEGRMPSGRRIVTGLTTIVHDERDVHVVRLLKGGTEDVRL